MSKSPSCGRQSHAPSLGVSSTRTLVWVKFVHNAIEIFSHSAEPRAIQFTVVRRVLITKSAAAGLVTSKNDAVGIGEGRGEGGEVVGVGLGRDVGSGVVG